MIRSENVLAGLAAALIDGRRKLAKAEHTLLLSAGAVPKADVDLVRKQITAGHDPLGETFCTLRSPTDRRLVGATYTPAAIVDAMVAWARSEPSEPIRIVDPGAGSGRYIVAAAKAFPKAELVAVDTDPLATLLLRANAEVLGLADRLQVHVVDYRQLTLREVKGPTLFIGNPPYVRHHDISERWKKWFADTAKAQGFRSSKLAGLHIHFFLKTRVLSKPGDFGAFITAAEWIDVNYGAVLRDMLADGLGGSVLHLIDPKARPFADALTTGAITCFRVGNRPTELKVRRASDLDDLSRASEGHSILWGDLEKTKRWSTLIRAEALPDPSMIELGELFRVHRGQVTGSNDTWIENEAMEGIPSRYLKATVTRARDLIGAGEVLATPDALKRVLDLPEELDELNTREMKAVERFLKWAKNRDAHNGYVAKHRRAWWAVRLRNPAPILCTYMARNAPTFVRNAADARHLNIAHGLYPRQSYTEEQLQAILRYLRRAITTDGGRVYAGGLVKFEPKELERLRIPALDRLHEYADSLEQPATSR